MKPFFRAICLAAFGPLLVLCAQASYLDDIGYTQLQAELGVSLPDGSGVAVSQIEAPFGGNYRPGAFTGVVFTYPDSTGLPIDTSSHAATVGSFLYGDSSMASGVTNVASYEANRWISAWLENGSTNAPDASVGKVHNFSWIGSFGNITADFSVLARMDFAISRDDVLAVFGLGNGPGSVPNLMASGFNGIAVGVTSGNHSYGTTNLTGVPAYGNSRRKPEIVAPADATSWATAIVSSAAVLLVDSGSGSGNANSMRSEVLKATLMAGATKSEFADWSNTSTNPLDDKYGAGELNIANSYHIQAAGEQNGAALPAADVSTTGWDSGSVASSSMFYFFDLTQEGSFSAVLTWNIEVVPNLTWSSLTLDLKNLDLKLYEATAFTIGDLMLESVSTLDNVELLWTESLGTGRYAIEVSSTGGPGTEYGLAWISTPVPEPNTIALLIGGAIAILATRRTYYNRSVAPRPSAPF